MNETSIEPKKKSGIFKDRPAVTIIAAGLLLLLIIVYAVFPLVGLNRISAGGGLGFDRSQLGQNFDPNNLPQRGNGSSGNFQPGSGNFNPNNLPQGTRSFNASGLARLFAILTGILRWSVIVLGILGVVGLWLKKRWGVVLAILISVVALGFTVPAMFRRMFSAFTIAQNAAILILAVGVVVLSILSLRTPKPEAAV